MSEGYTEYNREREGLGREKENESDVKGKKSARHRKELVALS